MQLLPTKVPNLYAAFVLRAIQALRPGGECVAIIPRSWTNGEYFAGFRQWIFEHASIDWMHIYGSRSEIFADTNVLQETMLVRFSKQKQVPVIRVTESMGKADAVTVSDYPAEQLICGQAKKRIVRIKPTENTFLSRLSTLKSIGLLASTGKIVDFRVKDKTMSEPGANHVPLVYACNFSKQGFQHPVNAGKMQWYWCRDEKDAKLLIGPGAFVVVKRFSAKEEVKRIKAYAFVTEEPVALENHLNYIHAGTSRAPVPLDTDVAKGLAIWLNSSVLDTWFRSISGSTQVNASDLNHLPVPPMQRLREVALGWQSDLTQERIDELCQSVSGFDESHCFL